MNLFLETNIFGAVLKSKRLSCEILLLLVRHFEIKEILITKYSNCEMEKVKPLKNYYIFPISIFLIKRILKINLVYFILSVA